MQSLIAVIQELSFARDIESVTGIVRRAVRAATGADGATFVFRQGDDCYYADEDAIAPLWKGRRFPMSACVSGWVMREGEPVVIEDIYADARVPVDAYRPTFVKSLAMVPVRAVDPIGAIGAYWARVHRASREQVEVLQQLANAASLAVRNVELYDSLHRAVARAESANRVKDDFLMLLSHELRTPLQPIAGWAALLEQMPDDRAAVAKAAAAIKRNARAEIALLDQLLDMSEISAGVSLEREPVQLAPLLDEALQELAVAARRKGIDVARTLSAKSAVVSGDSRRLRQALDNVLANAVKYTSSGGRIDVRLVEEDACARIDITDTGIGLPREALEQIFRPFGRLDSSMSRKFPGLGLGLALTRQIVQLHGGGVSAASEGEGRGATFTLRLPLLADDARRAAAAGRAGARTDGVESPLGTR